MVERAADQSAADALALERGVDRGVRELDPALAEAVLRDTGELAVEGPANTRQAQAAVLDWCYGFYNQVRRHNTIGMMSPINYENTAAPTGKPHKEPASVTDPPLNRQARMRVSVLGRPGRSFRGYRFW